MAYYCDVGAEVDFANGIQENLLALLYYDADAAKIVRHLVPAKYYSKFYREFFEAGADFLDRYGQPCGDHIIDEAERLAELHPKDQEIYVGLFRSIDQTRDQVNAEFVLARASRFMEFQTLKGALAQGLSTLEAGTEQAILETRAIFEGALKQSYEEFDHGLMLRDGARFLEFLQGERLRTWPTGIPELDRWGLGPMARRLHVLGAPYGKGKSWWLIQLAKHALASHASVLYVSLEMSIDEICERIAMSFFGYGKIQSPHKFFRINKDEGGRVLDLEAVKMAAPSLADLADQAELARLVGIFERRAPFCVKAWPSGKMTIGMLEAFLENLAAKEGFVPDVVIVDYLGIAKINNPANKRLELGQLAVDFRGMAQERNFAAVTVAQLNRSSMSTKTSTGEQVGEDFSIPQHADFFFTYNQTEDERKYHSARIYVDKGRPTKAGFSVLITQDYGRGQFCTDSAEMADSYWDLVEASNGSNP